ncbi:hypothetical protein [Aquirufa antheringensis]|uniref:hypothetical protein n=1 Tax=Aquirufa antheringensis TaxID=2516559 RepID=UPI001032F5AB|nr:hypothetical protein [Aquirufa antheringensis]TBH70432.1 hypothetical protein EWU21_07180 [Aquirufa antheringensis]
MVTISKTRLQALVTAAWLNRAMIAVVYIWFGFLKVLGTSPAEGLVTKLFNLTLEPFMGIQTFLLILGIGECAIGMLWLSPRLTKIAFWVMIAHLFTTFLPVLFLVEDTWQSFFSLTLTGQYIIKNVVLLSAAWFVYVFREEA